MLSEYAIWTAFVTGLLGSVHCIGMCGGIVGALTVGLRGQARRSWLVMLAYQFAYNLGRIASYTLAGCIVGMIGSRFYALSDQELAIQVSRWLTGGIMIVIGVYLGGWTRVLLTVERVGGYVWRYIEPLGRRFLPIRNGGQALVLGAVWGWLPCGLVYSMLVLAMATGDPWRGGQVMVLFGLGTLPMLLFVGTAAGWVTGLVRNHWVRRMAGAVVIGFGLFLLLFPAVHHGSGHH